MDVVTARKEEAEAAKEVIAAAQEAAAGAGGEEAGADVRTRGGQTALEAEVEQAERAQLQAYNAARWQALSAAGVRKMSELPAAARRAVAQDSAVVAAKAAVAVAKASCDR